MLDEGELKMQRKMITSPIPFLRLHFLAMLLAQRLVRESDLKMGKVRLAETEQIKNMDIKKQEINHLLIE